MTDANSIEFCLEGKDKDTHEIIKVVRDLFVFSENEVFDIDYLDAQFSDQNNEVCQFSHTGDFKFYISFKYKKSELNKATIENIDKVFMGQNDDYQEYDECLFRIISRKEKVSHDLTLLKNGVAIDNGTYSIGLSRKNYVDASQYLVRIDEKEMNKRKLADSGCESNFDLM